MPYKFVLALVLMLCHTNGFTSQAQHSAPQLPPKLKDLAKLEQWRHLLHYHRVGVLSTYQSQVDDPEFFFANDGAHRPEAELLATVNALNNSLDAQCRFPARMAWINQQRPNTIQPLGRCEQFERWRDQLAAEGLTVIFPAAYLNSPSSMFGHTLMRIDSSAHDNPLLDYSVNYAANADPSDNELVFSYKGLSGGYPGVFSVLPYYEKVKEYSYLESRDVWEYQIDINDQELAQFIRHVWEVKDAHFDYYFFTENCSYHLLTLLDAASERFDLADTFFSDVIPADTVRALNEAKLITQAEFRPSALARMQAMQTQMSEAQVKAAKQRVASGKLDLSNFSEAERAQVLELAYRYSRYLATKGKNNTGTLAKTTLGLLSERSKLSSTAVFAPHPVPETRDDQGHRSHRHQFSYGYAEQHYLEYGLRMSYHDWLDNIAGYIPGARLEIIHAKLRYKFDDQDLQLQSFRAIDIASLSPRDRFFKPLSWFVNTGLERPAFADTELLPQLSAGPGLSYQYDQHLVSALWDTRSGIDGDLDKGFFINSGPQLVWLYQTQALSFNLSYRYGIDVAGSRPKHQQFKIGVSGAINTRWQVRLEAQYDSFDQVLKSSDTNKGEHEYQAQGQVSFMHYF